MEPTQTSYESWKSGVVAFMAGDDNEFVPLTWNMIGQTVRSNAALPPIRPFYLGVRTIRIACTKYSNIKSLISKMMSEIECLSKCDYDEKRWTWRVEYGTRPLYEQSPRGYYKKSHIFNQMICGIEAAEKASKLSSNYDASSECEYEFNDRRDIFERRMWSRSEIRMYRDENDRILIEFCRLTGDHCSSSFIFSELKRNLSQAALLWESRKNYVLWKTGSTDYTCASSSLSAHGIIPENGDLLRNDILPARPSSKVPGAGENQRCIQSSSHNNNHHVERYLFDDMICREVCSYIGI